MCGVRSWNILWTQRLSHTHYVQNSWDFCWVLTLCVEEYTLYNVKNCFGVNYFEFSRWIISLMKNTQSVCAVIWNACRVLILLWMLNINDKRWIPRNGGYNALSLRQCVQSQVAEDESGRRGHSGWRENRREGIWRGIIEDIEHKKEDEERGSSVRENGARSCHKAQVEGSKMMAVKGNRVTQNTEEGEGSRSGRRDTPFEENPIFTFLEWMGFETRFIKKDLLCPCWPCLPLERRGGESEN